MPAPVIVTELDIPDDADALRFMVILYGQSIRTGFGATYVCAIRDLLNEIGTVPRRGHWKRPR
jgi:hypothetical protein